MKLKNEIKWLAVLCALFSCRVQPTDSSVDELKPTNLITEAFGILPGEIALTFDDGPGARTEELAQWLLRENVPATFFLVGRKAQPQRALVSRLSQMNLQSGERAFIIANHTMAHDDPGGSAAYAAQIVEADRVLSPYIKGDFFFRPPYGNLITSTWLKKRTEETESEFEWRKAAAYRNDVARIKALNQYAEIEKYIGPVLWNVGTAITTSGYAADWECWTLKLSDAERVKRCTDGYIKEVVDRQEQGQGALILAHDIHKLTVDMMIGTGPAQGRSLLRELRQRGFTFVALDKSPHAYNTFFNQQNEMH